MTKTFDSRLPLILVTIVHSVVHMRPLSCVFQQLFAGSKVWCGRYGPANQTLPRDKTHNWGDGGEVRRAGRLWTCVTGSSRSPPAAASRLSLSTWGKHDGAFCPLEGALLQEAADGRVAALGLFLPWPGWVWCSWSNPQFSFLCRCLNTVAKLHSGGVSKMEW